MLERPFVRDIIPLYSAYIPLTFPDRCTHTLQRSASLRHQLTSLLAGANYSSHNSILLLPSPSGHKVKCEQTTSQPYAAHFSSRSVYDSNKPVQQNSKLEQLATATRDIPTEGEGSFHRTTFGAKADNVEVGMKAGRRGPYLLSDPIMRDKVRLVASCGDK